MTNCYKRILLPLLIDKWQIATKEYFYHYYKRIDKWQIANKRILLPLLIDKWQIATKEYFYHY